MPAHYCRGIRTAEQPAKQACYDVAVLSANTDGHCRTRGVGSVRFEVEADGTDPADVVCRQEVIDRVGGSRIDRLNERDM